MTYTALEQSRLWEELQYSMNRYPTLYPSKLHCLRFAFFVPGNGHGWSQGILENLFGRDYRGLPPLSGIDSPYTPENPDTDPAQNPLFVSTPSIPDEQFLARLSDNAFTHDENNRKYLGEIYRVSDLCSVAEIPYEADVHYLTAAALLLRHIWQNQGRLDQTYYKGLESQLKIIKRALNAAFEIIEKRNLQEEFAKSCAEFKGKIPELTELTAFHIADSNKRYADDAAFKRRVDNLSDEERKLMAERVKKIIDEIENSGDSDKDRKKTPPAPGNPPAPS